MKLGEFREKTKDLPGDTEMYVESWNYLGLMDVIKVDTTEPQEGFHHPDEYKNPKRQGLVILFHEESHPIARKEFKEWFKALSPKEKDKAMQDLCGFP